MAPSPLTRRLLAGASVADVVLDGSGTRQALAEQVARLWTERAASRVG